MLLEYNLLQPIRIHQMCDSSPLPQCRNDAIIITEIARRYSPYPPPLPHFSPFVEPPFTLPHIVSVCRVVWTCCGSRRDVEKRVWPTSDCVVAYLCARSAMTSQPRRCPWTDDGLRQQEVQCWGQPKQAQTQQKPSRSRLVDNSQSQRTYIAHL